MNILKRITSPVYLLSIIFLFLYSYTQVDLSLTFSRASIFQTIEKGFQYVGYFQRPLSTELYIAIILLLFLCSIGLMILTKHGKIGRRTVWILLLFTAVVLTFSYNAFSYDLFNYIFDAKIVTHYFQNPYLHKALDYPHDPMLSFMHWTQRTYPYGPVWLFVTVPVSFIGSQIFSITFFLFKMLGSLSYLGISWCIEKVLMQKEEKESLFGLALFAFNPLVIIEGLVSAHNDMIMVLFASFALFLLMNRKNVWSFLLLFLSIGVKFATGILLPVWIVWAFLRKKESIERIAMISFLLLICGVVIASLRTNFQPWYLLFLYPFAALFPRKTPLVISFSVFTFASLLQYVPFLYTGNWNPPIPMILNNMLWGSLLISILVGGVPFLFHIAKRK